MGSPKSHWLVRRLFCRLCAFTALVLLSTFLTVGRQSAHAAEASRCSALFGSKSEEAVGSDFLRMMESLAGWRPAETADRFARGFEFVRDLHWSTAGLSSKSIGTFRIRESRYSTESLKIIVKQSQFVMGGGDSLGKLISHTYSSFVDRFKRFVIKNQSVRNLDDDRSSWSLETLNQVASDIDHFADATKFILVQDGSVKASDKTSLNGVIGAIKFVEASKRTSLSRIPLEAEYGIDLPVNAGRKIEIGNYTVDPKFNSVATFEIFFQMALEARDRIQDPGHVPDQPLFYVSADATRARLYEIMGMTKIKSVLDSKGETWFVLASSAEDLMVSILRQLNHPRRTRLEGAKARIEAIEILDGLQRTQAPLSFWHFPANESLRSHRAYEHVLSLTVSISEPSVLGNGGRVRRIEVGSPEDSVVDFAFFLPAAAVPLQDGFVFTHPTGLRLEYRDGELLASTPVYRFDSNSYVLSPRLAVQIDPYLRFPSGATFYPTQMPDLRR